MKDKLQNAADSRAPADLSQGIDILEESMRSLDKELLNILLLDRTTQKIARADF